jgi:hypothetical protein
MPNAGREYTHSVNQGKARSYHTGEHTIQQYKKEGSNGAENVDTFGVRPRWLLAKAWPRHVAFVTAGVRFSRVAPAKERKNVSFGFSIANPANKVKH